MCGLIAVLYPMFLMSFLAVRGLYPALLPAAALTPDDTAKLRWLDKSLGVYLILAASVPLLAIGLLAVVVGSENRPAMGVLSVVGLAGFALAYQLTAAIRGDIAAAAGVVAAGAGYCSIFARNLRKIFCSRGIASLGNPRNRHYRRIDNLISAIDGLIATEGCPAAQFARRVRDVLQFAEHGDINDVAVVSGLIKINTRCR